MAFADAIGRLMVDPSLGRRLGAAARRRVETECSAPTMAAGYLALFASLGVS
jgi:hypothetical protein